MASSGGMNTPISPKPGQVWSSRDPRDKGLTATVIDVANGFVRIQRHRKTTVSIRRFHREYELVSDADQSGKGVSEMATESLGQTQGGKPHTRIRAAQ